MKLLVPLVVYASIAMCIYCHSVALIKDYVKVNYLRSILMISCGNQYEVNSTEILLRNNGIWMNTVDISNESKIADFDYDNFFVRLSSSLSIVADLDCNQTSAFLTQMSQRILFHYERYWLIFSSSLEKSFNILRPQNINVDAEIILAIPDAVNISEITYDIYEVFNPSSKRGGRLNITRLGCWNEVMGFNIPLKQTKIERRRNLQGITFPAVVTLRNIPYNSTYLEHLRSNQFAHINSVSRINYRLFTLMMDMYKFKINIKVANLFAHLDSSGKWSGAIRMVNQNEVDFCLTSLRWENDRYGLLEHTTHSYHVQILFIFRHPQSVPTNVFLLPFESTLWYAIIGVALVCACIVRNMFSIENHKKVKALMNEEWVNEASYSNSVLMVFGFVFQQSYFGNLFLTSSRVLTIALLIFAMLIFQFYSSFIVGSLLTETPKNIKTIKQLMNSGLAFGLDETPYVVDNFYYAKEESTVKLYQKMMRNPEKSLMPARIGLSLVKKGGFAFNTDGLFVIFLCVFTNINVIKLLGSYAYNILNNILTDSEKCELQDILYIPKVAAAPVLPNKSAFRELIKISIHRITETGILSYYNKIFYGHRPKCEISEVVITPVDITRFSSALYILLIGIITSTILLILEIVIFQYSRREKLISYKN